MFSSPWNTPIRRSQSRTAAAHVRRAERRTARRIPARDRIRKMSPSPFGYVAHHATCSRATLRRAAVLRLPAAALRLRRAAVLRLSAAALRLRRAAAWSGPVPVLNWLHCQRALSRAIARRGELGGFFARNNFRIGCFQSELPVPEVRVGQADLARLFRPSLIDHRHRRQGFTRKHFR